MADAEKVRWFSAVVGPKCRKWFEQHDWATWAKLEELFIQTLAE